MVLLSVHSLYTNESFAGYKTAKDFFLDDFIFFSQQVGEISFPTVFFTKMTIFFEILFLSFFLKIGESLSQTSV